MPRQERIRLRRQADREHEERRERRLRDEELRDALEVAQHLAALGDERRHAREVAADEHEVGHGARHLRAGALRDRESRRLERGHVVDAVADHRDVAAVGGERLDDALLALRRDAADHRVLVDAAAAATPRRAAGRCRPPARRRRCPRPRRRPRPSPAGRPRGRRCARPATRRNATVSRASVAQPLAEDDEAERAARSRAASSVVDAARARCRTRRRAGRDRASSSATACRLAEREELGCAEHVRRRRRAAPRSSAGATRTARPPAAPLRRPCCKSAIAASVAFRGRRARGESSERVCELALVDAVGGDERLHLDARVRQRAGLVDADRVDRRERLDRVQLLRERAAARHAHRRDGVREAREQDQPLRDERDDGGDRRRHRVVHRGVAAVERPAERDAERDQHRDEDRAGAG